MSEQRIETLVKRMERLERENRWLRRMGGLMIIGIASVVLMDNPSVVERPTSLTLTKSLRG